MPMWQVAARARRRERLRTDLNYRLRTRSQQVASEERRRDRIKSDPEYRERFLARRRRQAMLRIDRLRADPAALKAYRQRRNGARDPEKRHRSNAMAHGRRRDRIRLDPIYRERRSEVQRASARRRAERLRSDSGYHQRFRDQQNEWYRKNAERLRRSARKRAAARRDALNARARQKYAEDPGRSLLYYKQWKARNPEKAASYQRASD